MKQLVRKYVDKFSRAKETAQETREKIRENDLIRIKAVEEELEKFKEATALFLEESGIDLEVNDVICVESQHYDFYGIRLLKNSGPLIKSYYIWKKDINKHSNVGIYNVFSGESGGRSEHPRGCQCVGYGVEGYLHLLTNLMLEWEGKVS